MRIIGALKIAVPLLLAALTPAAAAQSSSVPNPVLYLTGIEYYTAGGKNWVRHRYDVSNKDQYPAAMFEPAPNLPPCGTNTNSARSWVDFFDSRGQRLYGFCALGSPGNLGSIWFATEEGTIPPSYVYIVITDRQTSTTYRSNLADTTL